MNVKLMIEQHLGLLSLKSGCTGSSKSIHVKMPHCWKSHVTAHVCLLFYVMFNLSVGEYTYSEPIKFDDI